jgi:hypothetical protein
MTTKKTPSMKSNKINRPSFTKIDVDDPIELSAIEKAELEKQAREVIREEKKKRLKKEYLEILMRRLSGDVDIQHEQDEEEFVDYTIDLAPHADKIRLDNIIYFHGQTYKLNIHQLRTVQDIVAQTWRHERTIGNANRDFYIPPKRSNLVISPRNPMGK